jgi:hypothetical protein
MLISNLPARPILFLEWASVTVAIAVAPFWITTVLPTATSSSTSKSIESPTCAVEDETVVPKRSFTGVPSCKTEPEV